MKINHSWTGPGLWPTAPTRPATPPAPPPAWSAAPAVLRPLPPSSSSPPSSPLFRSALLAGTLILSSVPDATHRRSLLSRLSPPPPPLRTPGLPLLPHLRRRSPPFLHLSRARNPRRRLLLRSDLAAPPPATAAASPPPTRLRPTPPSSSSRPRPRLPKPYPVASPSHSSPYFFSYPSPDPSSSSSSSAAAAQIDGDDRHDRNLNLRALARGLDLDRRDAVAILYLIALLSSAHALAILGYVLTYASALGVVFLAVSNSYLRRPVPAANTFFSGARLGIQRLTAFVFLRWAARDALVQLLCFWFFADVPDQTDLFKLFVRAKLMPFSLTSGIGWPSSLGPHNSALSGFSFVWALLDSMVSVIFTVVPWVVVMDRNPRRPGRDAVKEGCFLVSLMPSQAILIKWSETLICGSLGRAVMVILAGKLFGGFLQSLAEVYFMVVWLVFYFAVRCKDAELEGRRFGPEDLEDCINALR
ncbi:uncharacterized protein LOC109714063 [Ananas comosus]|uniref:Uncharacterized protein LOC109714063 n=1 Tax=Ananas comosus TaxID=4615 RepID=A0A6P5FDQ5_ANACO|nr:uncharacterized protein LOC109714063 [Ananas comosus]